MSNKLATTDQGEKTPLRCTNIASWPGGDLYIEVRSGRLVPVDYDISVTVRPSNTTTSRMAPRSKPQQVRFSIYKYST